MSGLEISAEAVERGAVLYSNYAYVSADESTRAGYRCAADAVLRGGAPQVVADELDRLADEMERSPRHAPVTAEDVRARATQLRNAWLRSASREGVAR